MVTMAVTVTEVRRSFRKWRDDRSICDGKRFEMSSRASLVTFS
jgi:hypothetical protein